MIYSKFFRIGNSLIQKINNKYYVLLIKVVEFIEANFNPAGSDSKFTIPPDWKDNPKFLDNIADK